MATTGEKRRRAHGVGCSRGAGDGVWQDPHGRGLATWRAVHLPDAGGLRRRLQRLVCRPPGPRGLREHALDNGLQVIVLRRQALEPRQILDREAVPGHLPDLVTALRRAVIEAVGRREQGGLPLRRQLAAKQHPRENEAELPNVGRRCGLRGIERRGLAEGRAPELAGRGWAFEPRAPRILEARVAEVCDHGMPVAVHEIDVVFRQVAVLDGEHLENNEVSQKVDHERQ
mmetsp:Transcript_124097/g.358861  ORF Transcript_124097/g.358861 Transcript_124097/m.358861 type:complete len:229 (-) Transcript_124097:794-1480(-)